MKDKLINENYFIGKDGRIYETLREMKKVNLRWEAKYLYPKTRK